MAKKSKRAGKTPTRPRYLYVTNDRDVFGDDVRVSSTKSQAEDVAICNREARRVFGRIPQPGETLRFQVVPA